MHFPRHESTYIFTTIFLSSLIHKYSVFLSIFQFKTMAEAMLVPLGVFQKMTFCFLGTLVSNSVCFNGNSANHFSFINQTIFFLNFQSTIISDAVSVLDWHLLTKTELKAYQMFLHYVQQEKIIYILGIRPLNMATSLAVSS